jgi:hypothetical protein
VRAVALAALFLLLACAGAAAPSSKASRSDVSVFSGLGTWVDIYDGSVYAAPERTAARIAARHVATVWVETANYRSSADIVNAPRLARLVDALHGYGVKVVGWYLPGHVSPALDVRRALAMLSFRTASGQALDGVGLDIESTALESVGLRSQRAVALAKRVRAADPDMPLAIIPFNPRGLERHPHTWPKFPWAGLAATADAFAPMIYTSGSVRGFDGTYGYVTRALRLLRSETGEPDVPIHVIGGIANGLGPEELAGFSAAIADDGGTIGVSLYDWTTTRSTEWPVLDTLVR